MTGDARWMDVWTRAVIVPAWRRASAVWVGTAIAGGVIFGPSSMHPAELTGLALHHAGVGITLVVTWVLVFAPTARLIVRAEAAAYLQSLPGPLYAPRWIGGGALIGLQLPWLALWIVGEGLLGLAVVAAVTLAILALARWRPPPLRTGWPGWRDEGSALRSIHVRALRRRAGDALVRGAGLSLLAGATAGLFVRNNALAGPDAAVVGTSVIAIVLVPAEVGVLLVILATHRTTAWMAASLGIAYRTRALAVVYAIALVQLAATVIAIAAASILAELDGATVCWLAGTALTVAAASAMGCARVLLAAEDSPTIAARAVVGSVVVAAAAVLCLGLFGEAGAGAFAATCALALLTVRS
ncbi:MAG: hypothetical protein H6Q90_3165 [Deltaproteobacteria bacterium]|nr:hypothetical protein [Deltaproteobacteria bacterium]